MSLFTASQNPHTEHSALHTRTESGFKATTARTMHGHFCQLGTIQFVQSSLRPWILAVAGLFSTWGQRVLPPCGQEHLLQDSDTTAHLKNRVGWWEFEQTDGLFWVDAGESANPRDVTSRVSLHTGCVMSVHCVALQVNGSSRQKRNTCIAYFCLSVFIELSKWLSWTHQDARHDAPCVKRQVLGATSAHGWGVWSQSVVNVSGHSDVVLDHWKAAHVVVVPHFLNISCISSPYLLSSDSLRGTGPRMTAKQINLPKPVPI